MRFPSNVLCHHGCPCFTLVVCTEPSWFLYSCGMQRRSTGNSFIIRLSAVCLKCPSVVWTHVQAADVTNFTSLQRALSITKVSMCLCFRWQIPLRKENSSFCFSCSKELTGYFVNWNWLVVQARTTSLVTLNLRGNFERRPSLVKLHCSVYSDHRASSAFPASKMKEEGMLVLSFFFP